LRAALIHRSFPSSSSVRRTRANTVRIIGGVWRSRILEFPDAADLRPTPDRVRETLFNWLGRDLSGAACLDLFAGSGALGFEALSRGAASVVMVENNAAALGALRENATRLGAENVTFVRGDALEFARGARSRFDRFNVVFVDPPYRLCLQAAALGLVAGVLAEDGRVYVESDAVIEPSSGWAVVKHARAGRVHFHLLGREPDGQGSVSGHV
jgi:16S rRNA (guanine(966)-N(2))-methyltransferase RsmD